MTPTYEEALALYNEGSTDHKSYRITRDRAIRQDYTELLKQVKHTFAVELLACKYELCEATITGVVKKCR